MLDTESCLLAGAPPKTVLNPSADSISSQPQLISSRLMANPSGQVLNNDLLQSKLGLLTIVVL